LSEPHFVIPAESRGGFKPAPTANNAIFQGIAGQARNDGVFLILFIF